MAYERDDKWRSGRDERSARDEQRYSRGRNDDEHGRWGVTKREERGFFDRAGDEISSWFGGDEAERGEAERGRSRDQRGYSRDRDDSWFSSGRDRDDRERGYRSDRDERWFSSSRDRDEHDDRDHDEARKSRPMRWTSSNRDYREDHDRGAQGSGRYRPITGDYGRGARGDHERRDHERGSEWDRDPYRRTSFAGSAASSNHQDPPYDEWRRRRMEEMDRDYDDYRQESRSRFESDFGQWREQRQQKRGLLGKIREHMEVVGCDGEHVGTVDKIAGDRLILTKSDPASEGSHHSISCTMIDRVDNDEVVLDVDAFDAKKRWRDEDRERPLSEEQGHGEEGPHVLDRSFSGTYR
jgi:hypothetical protein